MKNVRVYDSNGDEVWTFANLPDNKASIESAIGAQLGTGRFKITWKAREKRADSKTGTMVFREFPRSRIVYIHGSKSLSQHMGSLPPQALSGLQTITHANVPYVLGQILESQKTIAQDIVIIRGLLLDMKEEFENDEQSYEEEGLETDDAQKEKSFLDKMSGIMQDPKYSGFISGILQNSEPEAMGAHIEQSIKQNPMIFKDILGEFIQ
jgi:hypothetical protein